MAIVSISKAAKLVRKGRQTLYNHNDKGTLSFTTTVDGKPGIDTAELVRVYGKLYMPADDVETAVQDTQSSIGQPGTVRSTAQSKVSNTVSMDKDAASTLSWFMEQVDEAREELEQTQVALEAREKSLAELRQAMASLPSPESVERQLKEQADHLKQQHNEVLDAERQLQAKTLAKQKEIEASRRDEWEKSIKARKLEIQQARAEADEIRQREQEQAQALVAERNRVTALESRGFIARLLNKMPEPIG